MVVFDLDGTIADDSHRLPLIKLENRWDEYFQLSYKDAPISWVIRLNGLVASGGHKIIILTGRSDIVKDDTSKWLEKYNVKYDDMIMRKNGDNEPSTTWKPKMMDIIEKKYGKCWFIVEDQNKNVKMWRELGYNVLQNMDVA